MATYWRGEEKEYGHAAMKTKRRTVLGARVNGDHVWA